MADEAATSRIQRMGYSLSRMECLFIRRMSCHERQNRDGGVAVGRFVHVAKAVRERYTVDTSGDLWTSVLEATR